MLNAYWMQYASLVISFQMEQYKKTKSTRIYTPHN
jgi:hypothetical protein